MTPDPLTRDGIWTDDDTGEGLYDGPYVAVDRSVIHLWAGGVHFEREESWLPGWSMRAARRTGLPVFVARRDYRRRLSIMWEADRG